MKKEINQLNKNNNFHNCYCCLIRCSNIYNQLHQKRCLVQQKIWFGKCNVVWVSVF